MPYTSPEMKEYGFAIAPGTETFLSVRPDVIHSHEDIIDIGYNRRGCYVDEEKELRFYKYYAYLNCFLECTSNYTFDVGLYIQSLISNDLLESSLFSIEMWMCCLLYAKRPQIHANLLTK